MNLRIVFTISSSFVISILVLYSIMNWYPSNFDPMYIWTESVELDPAQKKIFLFGSSHIGVLNSTYIQNYLIENGKDYKVYNLARPSDFPTRQIETLGQIIALKPKMVFYGIDDRMFAEQHSVSKEQLTALQITEINSVLPNVQDFFEDLFFPLYNNVFFSKIPKSPKIVTLQTIKHFVRNENQTTELNVNSNRPFIYINNEIEPIINQEKLKENWQKSNPPKSYEINHNTNREFDALKSIIVDLEKNDIKVVIFATPMSRVYFDWFSVNGKDGYDLLIKEISDLDTKVYPDYDKYVDLNIWMDEVHVVRNEPGIVYSQDIAKMIFSEIDS